VEQDAVEQQDAADEVRHSRWRPSLLILVLARHQWDQRASRNRTKTTYLRDANGTAAFTTLDRIEVAAIVSKRQWS